ncbi:MAG: RNase adapter RapZ [Deltaproteobacteria bacterium]|nr:RNase adapter RapZ [Deltaproteobacteria bacterium]
MKPLHTIIITGVSGGGKTTALHAVEDLGFYCVDNLPLPLLSDFLQTMQAEPSVDRVALVVDARLRKHIEDYALAYLALRSSGHIMEVIYLDAQDDVLVRRFSETRRPHPLATIDLRAGFEEERRLLAPLRAEATLALDTTGMTVHGLKQLVQDRYAHDGSRLGISLVSFGFRYGVPTQADLVLDVRFLPNPFFVEQLRPLAGTERAVSDYVLSAPDTAEFVERLDGLLGFLLPRYEAEGKVYLTIALGCTGGKHRSVALAEEFAKRLAPHWSVRVRHRDVDRDR